MPSMEGSNYDIQTILPKGWASEIREENGSASQEHGEGQRGETTEASPIPVYIYSLEDPETGEVRYVGKTIDLKRRFGYHCTTGREGQRKDRWVMNLKGRGLVPKMEVLEVVMCVEDEEWYEVEKFWIKYLRFLGCRLLNIEEGGRGKNRASKETREKLSIAGKGRKGPPMSPEHKAVLIASHVGVPQSDATKEKIRQANIRTNAIERLAGYKPPAGWNKGIPSSEETKAKQSAAHKAIGTGKGPKSPEHREKLRQALLGKKLSEEHRASLRGPRGPNIRTLRKLGLAHPKESPPNNLCTS